MLCGYGAVPWPPADGRPGWYVVHRRAVDGCRFTHEQPPAMVSDSLPDAASVDART